MSDGAKHTILEQAIAEALTEHAEATCRVNRLVLLLGKFTTIMAQPEWRKRVEADAIDPVANPMAKRLLALDEEARKELGPDVPVPF